MTWMCVQWAGESFTEYLHPRETKTIPNYSKLLFPKDLVTVSAYYLCVYPATLEKKKTN